MEMLYVAGELEQAADLAVKEALPAEYRSEALLAKTVLATREAGCGAEEERAYGEADDLDAPVPLSVVRIPDEKVPLAGGAGPGAVAGSGQQAYLDGDSHLRESMPFGFQKRSGRRGGAGPVGMGGAEPEGAGKLVTRYRGC